MNEIQWWLLIVGLVAGGAVVAVLTMSPRRTDDDLPPDERNAEATFIAAHLEATGENVDRATVARILETHREYLGLPAPDAIVPAESILGDSAADRDPDRPADEVRDDGGGPADDDLPRA